MRQSRRKPFARSASSCAAAWMLVAVLGVITTQFTSIHVTALSSLLSSSQLKAPATVPPPTAPPSTGTAAERAKIAKETWQRIALAQTPEKQYSVIELRSDQVDIYHNERYEEFVNSVCGTYFVNGLASCQIGDRIAHPFEAHGYMKRMTFTGTGQLQFCSTVINTPLTRLERFCNKMLARGVMSDLGSPIWNALTPSERNTANLAVTMWPPHQASQGISSQAQNSILVVAGDNGMPYCLDPVTLQTMGTLDQYIPALKGKKLLAHTRIDDERGRLILASSRFEINPTTQESSTIVEMFEIGTNWDVESSCTYKTRFMVFHDWMITDQYYVIPQNPYKFVWSNLPQFALGLSSGVDIFTMDDTARSEFLLIPRHDPSAPVLKCPSDSFFNIFHFGPCYEQTTKRTEEGPTTTSTGTNTTMVIHGSVFDRYEFGGEMGFDPTNQQFDPIGWSSSPDAPAPRLDRFVINLEDESQLHEQSESGHREVLLMERTRLNLFDSLTGEDIPVDMPTFIRDGAPCRFSYMLGASRPEGWFPFKSVVKLDLIIGEVGNWDAGEHGVLSEPMFVPRLKTPSFTVAEDDGYVLSILHEAKEATCRLLIWDSLHFDQGPIGSVKLGSLMPWCVHGTWVPNYVPPTPAKQ